MNIQSLPWLKFAHDAYLVSEFKAKANAFAKAAYLDLLCYAMKQTPALSLPNDDNVLAGWASLALEAWLQIKELVLSQFSFNQNDNRYYSPMLIELYSDTEQPKANTQVTPKRAKTNAERQADYRARKAAEKEALRNAQNNEVVTPQTVTCNAYVTASNVTCNEKSLHLGGKGGDLEFRLDNLDKNIVVTDIVTNQSVTPCNAVTPQQTTKFFMNFDFKIEPSELEPFMAKLEVPMSKHSSHTLGNFISYYVTKSYQNTRQEWVFQYAKWLERQREEVVEQPTTTSKPVAEFIQPVKPLWEILAEQKQQQQANAKTAEQLAKGDDALANIRKQLGLKAA